MSYEVTIKAYGVNGDTVFGVVRAGAVPTGEDSQENALKLGAKTLDHAGAALAEFQEQVAFESRLLGEEEDAIAQGECPSCRHPITSHDGGGCGVCDCHQVRLTGPGA